MTVTGDDGWPLTGRVDELAAAVAAVQRVGGAGGAGAGARWVAGMLTGGAGVGAARGGREAEVVSATVRATRFGRTAGAGSAGGAGVGATRVEPAAGGVAAVAGDAGATRVGRVAGVVLAGGAGVGATRLARETVAAVGRPARWVAGSRSARSVPWGALAPLLGGEPPSITAAVAALVGAGHVLAVDDAHLLDDASAAAVRHVALSGRSAVVLTVRSGRAGPDAITALWKDGTLPRIDLAPLNAEEGRTLVEAALGGLVDPLTAARLFALTRGNPQFLRQVVEDERATGRLAAVEGVWRWRGRFVPSARLDELVAARIEPGADGAGLRRLRRVVACRASLFPLDGEAALDGALRSAMARLDVEGVERLARCAAGAEAVEARRWVAAVRAGGLLVGADVGLQRALAGVPPGGPAARRSEGAAAWLREDVLGVAALAHRLAGRLDATPPPEIEADLGPSAAAIRAVTAGLLALDRGLVATAIRDLRAAPIAPGEPWIGRCDWAAQRQIGLAQALAMAGDPAAARAALAAAAPDSPAGARVSTTSPRAGARDESVGAWVVGGAPGGGSVGDGVAGGLPGAGYLGGTPPVPVWLRPQVALAQAWVAAAEGALSEAVAHSRRAGDLAAAAGQVAVEVLARHTGVRFGDRAAADRLTALTAAVDTPRATIGATHAAALARDDGAGLDAVAVRWAGTGAVALAADAAAQAALAHRARGARGSALASASRADRWAAACSGLRTPALLAAARPLPLTDREREMTMLASAGLTNRAIAERLCVSVRTVEGHLYRACAKLAVPNRAALAAVLTDSALPA